MFFGLFFVGQCFQVGTSPGLFNWHEIWKLCSFGSRSCFCLSLQDSKHNRGPKVIKIPFDIIKYDNNKNNKFWMATNPIYRKHFTISNNFVCASVTLNWVILTSTTFFNINFSLDGIPFVFVMFFFCLFTCFFQKLSFIWCKALADVNERFWISFLLFIVFRQRWVVQNYLIDMKFENFVLLVVEVIFLSPSETV